MSRIVAAMHFFEVQARESNDALQSHVQEQDANLERKENLSIILDKMTQMQGARSAERLKEAGNTASESVVKTAWSMISKGPFPLTVPQPSEPIDPVGDRITELNTKTQIYLTEAQDGEARVEGLLSDYKSLLQEMRKG